ncbi:hypothetical protein ACR9E3_02990 [Actinomycetospora sp. C-140]
MLTDLRREIDDPPGDIDTADLAEFAGMIERSLVGEVAAAS